MHAYHRRQLYRRHGDSNFPRDSVTRQHSTHAYRRPAPQNRICSDGRVIDHRHLPRVRHRRCRVKKEFSRWRRSRLEQVSRFCSGRTCARVCVCVHRACAPRVCRCRLAGAGAPTTAWPGEGHGCARGENGRNPVESSGRETRAPKAVRSPAPLSLPAGEVTRIPHTHTRAHSRGHTHTRAHSRTHTHTFTHSHSHINAGFARPPHLAPSLVYLLLPV